jgi:PqqD family protein of HPr-rel-A system
VPTLDDEPRWTTIQGFSLQWRSWGNEHLVFHPGSGDTHLLDSQSAQVLKEIQNRPMGNMELRQLIEKHSSVDQHTAQICLAQTLSRLFQLGLIERL